MTSASEVAAAFDACPVCLSDVALAPVALAPCGHVVCGACVRALECRAAPARARCPLRCGVVRDAALLVGACERVRAAVAARGAELAAEHDELVAWWRVERRAPRTRLSIRLCDSHGRSMRMTDGEALLLRRAVEQHFVAVDDDHDDDDARPVARRRRDTDGIDVVALAACMYAPVALLARYGADFGVVLRVVCYFALSFVAWIAYVMNRPRTTAITT